MCCTVSLSNQTNKRVCCIHVTSKVVLFRSGAEIFACTHQRHLEEVTQRKERVEQKELSLTVCRFVTLMISLVSEFGHRDVTFGIPMIIAA